MQVNQLGDQIGAEILDVDVRQLAPCDFDKIYETWLQFNIIAVRDQNLTIEEFLAYSRGFGELLLHPSKMTRHPQHPELTVMGINKFDADGQLLRSVYARGGETWHTDGAYEKVSFKATQLYALAIPSVGGDTLFASMYAAYEALSASLKQQLEGRLGAFTYGGRTGSSNALLNPEDQHEPPAMHPILRTHPETGRTGMYFDPGKILYIEGFTEQESEAIIEELTEYMIQPGAQYRHQWREGDIVIWDNRCTYHIAAADYPPEEDRIHWRVSVHDDAST
jgi:taurine dioxygenase